MPHLKYTSLLISLSFLLLISPLFEGLHVANIIVSILFSAVLVSAVYAVSQKKGLFAFSILLLCPALVGSWSVYFIESLSLEVIGKSFSAFFLVFSAISMLNHVFREDYVTVDTIAGAICVYLLIGLTWAYLYSVTELLLPGAFIFEPFTARASGSLVHDKSSLFFYYSFVTLTTLGYGDITPITPLARSLSMLEAVIGPIYLTVLVARLVALQISHSGQDRPR
jgi:hypothetical protein